MQERCPDRPIFSAWAFAGSRYNPRQSRARGTPGLNRPCRHGGNMRHIMAFGLSLALFGAAQAGTPAGAAPAEKSPTATTPEYVIKNTPSGDAALARLKGLVGSWTGTTKEGKPVQVTYRMISNDTCLEESIHSADAMDMVSVYCPDRDGVMMTHFCASN